MHYITNIRGELRLANTHPPLMSEPAIGYRAAPEDDVTQRLVCEAEALWRHVRWARGGAGAVNSPSRIKSTDDACAALCLRALAFSLRVRASSLAVPVEIDTEPEGQRALWRLARSGARLGDPLTLDGDQDGGICAACRGEVLGRVGEADALWLRPLTGFGVRAYVGRLEGVVERGYRLRLTVVLGHVGAALIARARALGLDHEPAPEHVLPGGGDGQAGDPPAIA